MIQIEGDASECEYLAGWSVVFTIGRTITRIDGISIQEFDIRSRPARNHGFELKKTEGNFLDMYHLCWISSMEVRTVEAAGIEPGLGYDFEKGFKPWIGL